MKKSILYVMALSLYGCAGNESKSVVIADTQQAANFTPAVAKQVKKTGKVEITNGEPFFQGMDDLLPKIKKFDPSMGELKDMASDSLFYEAKDAHHNKLWVAGANNGPTELSWIWNHDGFQKPIGNSLNNFSAVAKMMCGQDGSKWILSELKKPVTVEKWIRDTTYINHNELIFYNDCLTTINFTVKVL